MKTTNIQQPLKSMDLKEVASLPKRIKEKFLFYLDEEKLLNAIIQLLDLTHEQEYVLENDLFDYFFYDDDFLYDENLMELYKLTNSASLVEWLLKQFKVDFDFSIQRIDGEIWMIEYENDIEMNYITAWADQNMLEYEVDGKVVNIFGMNEEQTIDVFFLKIRCDDENKMEHLDCERVVGTNEYIAFSVVDNSNGIIYNRDLKSYSIPNIVVSFMEGYDVGEVSKTPIKYQMYFDIKKQIVKRISQTKEVVF